MPTAERDLKPLFEVFRASDYVSLSLKKAARHFGVPEHEFRDWVLARSELALSRRKGPYGEFEIVAPALTEESLSLLPPIPLASLQKLFRSEGELKALHELLQQGVADGQYHVAEGVLQPGPGVSEAIVPPPMGGSMVAGPLVNKASPLAAVDFQILNHLEDLEAERINFGLYDTFVSIDELHVRVETQNPGLLAGSTDALEKAIDRLASNFLLLRLDGDRVRSRISEIVRVLRRVKQRFANTDAATAPYLVHSIRVHFEDRRRLDRKHLLKDGLQYLFEHHGSGRKVDMARKALVKAIGAALGSDIVRLTAVQQRALTSVGGQYLKQDGRGFVITGNTGSGKTEAALFPLLLGAVEERLSADVPGCKIVLVYPRQELAKNQLQRICRYLAFLNRELEGMRGGAKGRLSVGIVFGDTPPDEAALTRGDKFRKAWMEKHGGREFPYFLNEHDDPVVLTTLADGIGTITSTANGFADGGWQLEGFRATREAVLRDPPDVLVITTEMLHRWLMDPRANNVFGLSGKFGKAASFAPPRAILFDEIHLYDTIHGAQVGMLIRRLRHRIRQAMYADKEDHWKYPLTIGMSATIGSPRTFWSKLCGLEEGLIDEISPQEEDLEDSQGREYFLFIRPETYSRGRLVGDASSAIQSIMSIAHNMVRRGPSDDEPPKHRTLVFQDSISKLKKLAVEFRDAESNRFLAALRLHAPDDEILSSSSFANGEYWWFDAQDPRQYNEKRSHPGDPPTSLTSPASPVYSGSKGAEMLKNDIVFATSVLEVGYDDPSIQFVFQHHAPRNPASFVQKKGRAGRSLQDRPITAVTLSRHAYRDAFYYQNPQLLYDPADYRPPLNVENYFVQRFQALALLLDELTRITGKEWSRLPKGATAAQLKTQIGEITKLVAKYATPLRFAFEDVTAESFRRVHASIAEVWQTFEEDFSDPEIAWQVVRAGSLLRGHPGLPDNLFSTLNLPTVQVMYYIQTREGAIPKSEQEDVSLVFGEVTPGKVTRRYGPRFSLLWRAPKPWVAIERFKTRPDRPKGPFNPRLLTPLADIWGPDWQHVLPHGVRRAYPDAPPARFYRARYFELWTFGTLDPNNPRVPRPDWNWWARLESDGSALVQYDEKGNRPDPWRRVLPESTSYSLSFSYGHPLPDEVGPGAPSSFITLPPLFGEWVERFDIFAGEVDGRRSALKVWEVQYGAEAQVRLERKSATDTHTGTGVNLVRYKSDHDGQPTLYGYDLTTEGIRVPFNEARLRELADAVFEELWGDDSLRSHLQDQYLRYLLKTERWPDQGELTLYDLRTAGELLSTLRAETRAEGVELGDFLDRVTSPAGLATLLHEVGDTYWRDPRLLNDAFVDRLRSGLTRPTTHPFLEEIFGRLGKKKAVQTYLQSTLVHSLKHAVRHFFVIEGSTGDEQTGSFGMMPISHGQWSPSHAFFVYERNQDGSGATRLVAELGRPERMAHLVERWWDVTMACPVGDEEDFLRTAIRRHGVALEQFATTFFATPPAERQSPEPFLRKLLPELLPESEQYVDRLAGIITSEFSFGAGSIPLIALHHELQRLEDELSGRFHRPPTLTELAGFVATRVEQDIKPPAFPALRRLLDLYDEHAQVLNEHVDDEGEPANALDRFIDQISHLSLHTCVDACPACLASDCDIDHIDTMRHTLSRRYLKIAHRTLSAPFTVEYSPEIDVEHLIDVARTNAGWAILTYRTRLPSTLSLGLHNCFDDVGRIFDHERSEVRRILRLREV